METSHKKIYQIIYNWSLKKVLVSTALPVIFIVVVYFLSLQNFGDENHDKFVSTPPTHDKDILMDISGVNYLSSKGGVKQWILKASHMCIDDKRGKAFICNPEIEFFLKGDEKFYLFAKSGLIDNSSDSISTFGDVHIHGWDITVETDHAEYDSISLSLISKKPTVFFDNDFSVQSDSLVINLINELFQFDGNVKSKFGSIP